MTHHTTLSRRAETAHALTLATLADVDATAALNALVQLAVTRIGADGGQVSMLTDRQVSLCAHGPSSAGAPDGTEHPFEETMCAYALRADDTLVIRDARADERVAGIEAVVGGHVGAYLGVPVRTADHLLVGVLCVFSETPREWTDTEQADMEDLATHVAAELERALPTDRERVR